MTVAPDGPGAILGEWYAGEVGGEALFWGLAEPADPIAARKWLTLAAVEARVAQCLLHVLLTASLSVPSTEASLAWARSRAAAMAARPWAEQMAWLEGLAREALESMQHEAAALPASLAAIGALVVRHEATLVDFARRELAGDGAGSLGPVEEFLATTARP